MLSTLLSRIGELNPQLFREVKGRCQLRNLAIAVIFSSTVQLLLYLLFNSRLPSKFETFHRYCTGVIPTDWQGYTQIPLSRDRFCQQDAFGYLLPETLNWHLWWLDLFVSLSIIGIFVLLVGGTYLLVADLSKESHRRTLGFIRLSPQSPQSIVFGKMLGVPILLYWLVALALPFHLTAGLKAEIPLPLILSFYALSLVSCFFFYSAAILYGLIGTGFGTLQALGSSSVILGFLALMTWRFFGDSGEIISFSPADGLIGLYPGAILPYLISTTPHSLDTIGYLNVKDFVQLTWFNWHLFDRASGMMVFAIANNLLLTYGVWRGLKRRFHNPNIAIVSRLDSYYLSGCAAVILLGFTVQHHVWQHDDYRLYYNFSILSVVTLIAFLGLSFALSSQPQTLQNWARYRHQMRQNPRNLLKDLLWGEKSPATLAIALNLLIVASIFSIGIFVFPFKTYRIPALLGLGVTVSIILIYTSAIQWILMLKTPKRSLWALLTAAIAISLPLASFALLGIPVHGSGAWLWLFSAVPVLAAEYIRPSTILISLLVQWSAIALIHIGFAQRLRKLGESSSPTISV
ncbi:hypothetical protein IQ249_18145 [Lusitaniella coriacea LEGE 07157]|uniref:Uncharacterized protein n=1 Tax=Lusitaniella coriacea LEGE 07157 TaxID=945747 RepID=A0A8J7E2W9_9CYAN|nr:hypothetical protein [Lusitaniella coriacea]MBE9117824.1 hypothetical protein [Lusitaniella coriacea LEGE 07157]